MYFTSKLSVLYSTLVFVLLATCAAPAQTTSPTVTIQTFDPTSVNPNAKRFQLADYDAQRSQVIFYPEGNFPGISLSPSALGTVLTYNTAGNFTDPASYHAYDLTQLVDPAASGFCGGFLDENNNSAYLVPLYQIVNGKGVPNGLAVKIDLSKDLSSASAYQKFDISTLGISPIGYCDGIAVNGYVYYMPVGQRTNLSGNFLRYDSSQSFTSSSAWSWFDLTKLNSNTVGFQSVAYIPPYIYLIPFFQTVLVRYNTTLPLESASSYEAFDLSSVTPEPRGLTGAVAVGNRLVIIPWDNPVALKAITVALLYDTTQPLSATSAWTQMDLSAVDPHAGGYQFGWLDRGGFVWFVPDNYLSLGFYGVPPLITWNSRLPFNQASSWTTFSSAGIVPSTGAAYDPATNTAWLAPYGNSSNFSISKLQITDPGGTPPPPAAVISHLANGGGPATGGDWSTTILLVNADTHTASYQLNFYSELDGSPLVLPLLNYGPQSSVSGTLAPGELAVIQTDGSGSTLLEGWAELVTSAAIGGTGIFTDQEASGNRQEAAVPLNSAGGTKLFIPFDETSAGAAAATGIALANTGASQANVTAAFVDYAGNKTTATTSITIAAGTHTAFLLVDKFPEEKGKRGTVEFTSNVAIYGLGIRYNGTAFTSIGALSNVPSGNKVISHLTNGGDPHNGGDWSTTILLVNADTQTASYQLNFHSETNGSPLAMPLVTGGSHSSVSGTLAPGQLAVIQTDGSGSTLVEGWAELVTTSAIGGTGIFTDLTVGQQAAVPLNSTGGTQLFIPFDETTGAIKFGTGIALANTGAAQANVTAAFVDDAGNKILTSTTQITIAPGAHIAFVLTEPGKFPELAGKRGAVRFTSNVPIYGLGIRYNGTAFTSIGAIIP